MFIAESKHRWSYLALGHFTLGLLALSRLACCATARGEEKLDKAQIEQFEALERLILYNPHQYGESDLAAFQKRGGRRIDYKTTQGNQAAWLIPKTKGRTPQKLWVFCGGNGTLGLDLESIARAAGLMPMHSSLSTTRASAGCARVHRAPKASGKTCGNRSWRR